MPKQIHWFPGHMKKALDEIDNKIKIVDVVIELLDARAPLSSVNFALQDLTKNKKKLIVISKPDLADPIQNQKWEQYFANQGNKVLLLDLTNNNATNVISNAVIALGKDKWEKEKSRGMKPQPIRAMIIGIPNVGKSSLINRMAKRKAAGVQNKPGYTRGEQWIKVNQNFILLDTPGILPMNYDDKNHATNLALIGSIKEDILPNTDLVHALLDNLKTHYQDSLKQRFDIDEISDYKTVLTHICDKRKLLNSSGQSDLLKAETLLLKEFKSGLLGRITLEWL